MSLALALPLYTVKNFGMKHLLTALLVVCASAQAAHKTAHREKSPVSQCFKVRRLLKTDSTHYWADWSNTCPYTIDAVYVTVGFLDRSQREMGSGVWPMYFVTPGQHRVTRFSAPVADFETVRVHAITTDSVAALFADQLALDAVRKQSLPAGTVGDTAIGEVIAHKPESSGNKTQF
jgi:hypothetical protein